MTNVLKTIGILFATIAITLGAIVIAWLVIFTLYVYSITDTSDWFAPTNATLEVVEGGTLYAQTYNPQPKTIDGSQLQQTADRETTEKFIRGEL